MRGQQQRNPDPSIGAAAWSRGFAAMATAMLLFAANAQVQAPAAPATDLALEARVKALSSELRCLVCQNQTIADSDAPVARDLRDQVRTQLAQGKSEAEVKAYMTDRFGDFVLYKPAFKATTLALWAGPFVALLFAGVLLVRRVRRRESRVQPAALTDIERERARALLDDSKDPPAV